MTKLSVVIPVFNERKTIGTIINRVLAEETPKEIIIVDDGSTDGTWEIIQNSIRQQADKIQNFNSKLKVLKNEKNTGKGAAVRKGIDNATGDVLIIQDADLEYDPKYYKQLLTPITSGKTKVVYGSRLKTMKLAFWGKEKTPMPLHYLANLFLSFLTNILYGSNLTDMETGYKMMTKEVYKSLDLKSNRFEIEPEITGKIANLGYQILEIPIETKPRDYRHGKKIKARDALTAVNTLFKYSSAGILFKLLGIFLFPIVLFFSTFSYYFTQDDFFHLKISQTKNLSEFFLFFSPQNPFGYNFYRPLTIQTFLFLGRSIFGLNQLPFRVIIFLFFLCNIYLVFKIVNKLTFDRDIGLLAAFLYGCASVHFATLSYISTFVDIGATFFLFLTVFFYLKQKKISWLFFVLSLFSLETSIILPIVIFLIELLGNRRFKKTIPYIVILIIYFLFRWSFFRVPNVHVYNFSLSIKSTLNNIFWYIFWSAGAPENFIDFVGSGFKLTSRFYSVFGWQGYVMIFGSLFILLNIVAGFLKVFKSDRGRNYLLIFFMWFFVGLTPFIFWPQHKFVYYLEFSLLGFCALFSLSLSKSSRILRNAGILIYLLVSILTINFYRRNYWVVNRSKIAKNTIVELKKTYPSFPSGSVLYFKNDQNFQYISKEWGGTSSQVKIAISGCNAVQLFYKDETLKCYFEDDHQKIAEKDVYSFTAKIN